MSLIVGIRGCEGHSGMMKIAIPNKGSLSESSVSLFKEAGYTQRRDRRQLVVRDTRHDVEFFYLRPRDIAVYIGTGDVDLGITGQDLLQDSAVEAMQLLELGFGNSDFYFASTAGTINCHTDVDGKTIATSYPVLVKNYLDKLGISASVIRLEGAVETAISLGLAQVIADVVETGSTLRQAGLEIVGEPIFSSQAVAIAGKKDKHTAEIDTVIRRLQGILIARRYVMIDYNVPADLIEQACALTPGLQAPTVSRLHDPAWMAVRSMQLRAEAHSIMDQLYALGARAVLMTRIDATRL